MKLSRNIPIIILVLITLIIGFVIRRKIKNKKQLNIEDSMPNLVPKPVPKPVPKVDEKEGFGNADKKFAFEITADELNNGKFDITKAGRDGDLMKELAYELRQPA
jgi:hypothetical protein